jgi:hypothetical protein
MDDSSDGEDLRVDWVTDHWVLGNGGGPTTIVPPALLTNRAASPQAPAAASDPGSGGFNPFTTEAASAPEAAPDDGGSMGTWGVGLVALVLVSAAGYWRMSSGKPKTTDRKSPGG